MKKNPARRKSRHFKKRKAPVGASPGTLVLNAESPLPKMSIMSYSATTIDERDIASTEELKTLRDDDFVHWIDVQGLGDENTLRQLAEIFSIHPLALEDIVHAPQRPKSDPYDANHLLITRMVRFGEHGELDIEQVSLVIGTNYVLTFQERPGDVLDPVRKRLAAGGAPIRSLGADHLAYAIFDTIVDGFYPVVESLGEMIENLEDTVIRNPDAGALERISDLRALLMNLRRSLWPQREALTTLVRDPQKFISDDVRVFLRDTLDHTYQLIEVLESHREVASGLMSTYLTVVSNRMNEIMKVLTIMASIFIPLTFMAGVYGMNFEHMPELRVPWAYPALWIAMLTVAGGMLVFFWRKGWLGPRSAT